MPDNDVAKTKLADVSLAFYVADPHRPKSVYDSIENLADRLLAKNQRSFDGLRLKGSLRLLDRNPQAAIALFEKANEVEPQRPDLLQGWVQALFQDNRFPEGEHMAMQVVENNKTFGPMYDLLYRHYVAANRTAAAENILKTKVANNPKDIDCLLQLARYYATERRMDEANRLLERALRSPQDFPHARLQVGQFYGSIGQWQQALPQFEAGERSDPTEKVAYQKEATDALLALGRTDEALRKVESILKEKPADLDARRVRATILLDSGVPDKVAVARTELQTLVQSKANDARLRFLLARADSAQGNLEAAKKEFQEVLRLRPDDVPSRLALATIALNQQKPQEALRYCGEILAQDAENAPAKLLRVNAMIAAGYYGDAQAELTRLLHQYPKSAEVQLEFGMLAIAQKKFKEAEVVFQKLYEPGQSDDRPASALVETFAAEDELDRAVQWLAEASKKTPESVTIRKLLAQTAARARKYDLAIAQYTALLAKDPASVALHLQLGEVYHLKGDLKEAINALEQAERLAPNNPEPIMLLAATLGDAGRNEEAKAKCQRVLELRPDNPFVLNNIAFLLAETNGNLDEALRLSQRALQKAPAQPVLRDTLGWIYLKKGMKDSAIRTFSLLVQQNPHNPTFHYHFAEALFENGDIQLAKIELEKALQEGPSPEIEKKIKALVSSLS
jgi:tetratricopeptide (TPR) repeat protein